MWDHKITGISSKLLHAMVLRGSPIPFSRSLVPNNKLELTHPFEPNTKRVDSTQ
jgi:hypothetical protein